MQAEGSTSATGITKPQKTGYTFQGYYTGTNGTGTKVIDSAGKLVANATNYRLFTANGTLYASWTKNTTTTYSCRRRTVTYLASQVSCTQGSYFWANYIADCTKLTDSGYTYDGSGGPNGGYCTCTNPHTTAWNVYYGSWSGYTTYSSYPYTAGYEYQCTTT